MASEGSEHLHHFIERLYHQVSLDLVPTSIVFLKSVLASRIWDVEDKRKQKTVIVVKSKERGTRTKVTACAYSHDGKLIAGGELLYDVQPHRW